MNAQQNWKSWYKGFRKVERPIYNRAYRQWRIEMIRFRREAALERKLEAANRRIEALEALLTGMSRMVEQRDRILSDHDARLLEQWHERM